MLSIQLVTYNYLNIKKMKNIYFFILGGVFGTLIFLPEMASWHEAFPDAVRENPDFLSGFIVGLIQLIALIVLLDKLNIDNLKDGAIFGLV